MMYRADLSRGGPMQSTMMFAPLSLNGVLERAGTLFRDSEIITRLPDKSLRRHTHGAWYRRTRALASALQRFGLQKGERVATLCWNHHAHLEAFFGIPAAGGVLHTLNLRLAPADIGWIAHHAADRVLIVDDILLPLYRQFAALHAFEKVVVFPYSGAPVPGEFTDYEHFLATGDPDDFDYAAHAETDPVAMCYTSGTTGRPKGVVYSHRSALLHVLVAALADYMAVRSRDVLLPVTPMFHVNSWGVPYAAIMLGTRLVLPGPHLRAEDLLDLMQLEPPTLALGVPTVWMGLIQAYERGLEEQPGRWRLPPGMRSFVGGSAVPEALIRAFARHGVQIVQGWGMTETSPVATVSYLTSALAAVSEDERVRRSAMVGLPVPLVELRLRSDAGRDAACDGSTMGEVQVRGPFITGAYHEVGVSPESFTEDGWLRTGDVATQDGQGYLRITDRTKDLIKSGGEWISSVALENALMSHPAVVEAAVIAIPHERWGERPLACVVFKPGQSCDSGSLDAYLVEQGFARWQCPERYEPIDEVPRTSTGKFWKLKLRERFSH